MSQPESRPHESGVFRFVLDGEDRAIYRVYNAEGEWIATMEFPLSIDEETTDNCANTFRLLAARWRAAARRAKMTIVKG